MPSHLRSTTSIGLAALVLVALAAGTASGSASDLSHPALLASGGHPDGLASIGAIPESGKGRCGTRFGPPPSDPDGVIAWNDTTGSAADIAGAADFGCASRTSLTRVVTYGYGGAVSELFNVTFFANDRADGSDEADDARVLCSYAGIPGRAGGQYPTATRTVLRLPTPCTVPAGEAWVSVQNYDADSPWYWEIQSRQSGITGPDWVDHHTYLSNHCMALDNDSYLRDCNGYDYADWMLELR